MAYRMKAFYRMLDFAMLCILSKAVQATTELAIVFRRVIGTHSYAQAAAAAAAAPEEPAGDALPKLVFLLNGQVLPASSTIFQVNFEHTPISMPLKSRL